MESVRGVKDGKEDDFVGSVGGRLRLTGSGIGAPGTIPPPPGATGNDRFVGLEGLMGFEVEASVALFATVVEIWDAVVGAIEPVDGIGGKV